MTSGASKTRLIAMYILWAGCFAAPGVFFCDGGRACAPNEGSHSPKVESLQGASPDGGEKGHGPSRAGSRPHNPVDHAVLEDGKRALGVGLQYICKIWHSELSREYSSLRERESEVSHAKLFELRVRHEGDISETFALAHELAASVEGTIVSVPPEALISSEGSLPPEGSRERWEWEKYDHDLLSVSYAIMRLHKRAGILYRSPSIWHKVPYSVKSIVGEKEFVYWACGGARFLVKLKKEGLKERDKAIARLRTDPRVFAAGPTWDVPPKQQRRRRSWPYLLENAP